MINTKKKHKSQTQFGRGEQKFKRRRRKNDHGAFDF